MRLLGIDQRSSLSHCGLIVHLFVPLLGLRLTLWYMAWRQCCLLKLISLRVKLEHQIFETDWAQSRYDQLSLLDERRLRAADHVQAYQRKMTRAFRKRVKPRKFQKGDLVLKVLRGLINDPRGKFRPNWSGPYVIRDLTQEGAAWLTDLDGNQFTEPVNVDQLKRFYA